MNQEIGQSEDKPQITDESNCKNSTLVNLLQKWKKLIELKKIDATRKDSLSLASGNYPKLKRTSGTFYPVKQILCAFFTIFCYIWSFLLCLIIFQSL